MSSGELEEQIMNNPEYEKWKKEKEQKKLSVPDYERLFQKYGDKEINLFYNKKTVKLKRVREELAKKCPVNILYEYAKYALDFYVDLYICQKIFCYQNMKPKKERDAVLDQYLTDKEKYFAEKYAKYEELACLIEDCFLQFRRMYQDITELDYYPDAYYKQFQSATVTDGGKEKDGFYYTAALRYIGVDRYIPYLSKKESVGSTNGPGGNPEYIDAYTDLYFFGLLKAEMDKVEKENKDKDKSKHTKDMKN